MRTLALAVAMLLGFAAVADARTWRGQTEQKRAVSIRTDENGEVQQVRVAWKARCEDGTYKGRTVFDGPFDISEKTLFEDSATYGVDAGDGYRARHRVFVRGRLDEDDWSGTFRARTRVKKDGRVVDRCRLGGVRWTAEPV